MGTKQTRAKASPRILMEALTLYFQMFLKAMTLAIPFFDDIADDSISLNPIQISCHKCNVLENRIIEKSVFLHVVR